MKFICTTLLAGISFLSLNAMAMPSAVPEIQDLKKEIVHTKKMIRVHESAKESFKNLSIEASKYYWSGKALKALPYIPLGLLATDFLLVDMWGLDIAVLSQPATTLPVFIALTGPDAFAFGIGIDAIRDIAKDTCVTLEITEITETRTFKKGLRAYSIQLGTEATKSQLYQLISRSYAAEEDLLYQNFEDLGQVEVNQNDVGEFFNILRDDTHTVEKIKKYEIATDLMLEFYKQKLKILQNLLTMNKPW